MEKKDKVKIITCTIIVALSCAEMLFIDFCSQNNYLIAKGSEWGGTNGINLVNFWTLGIIFFIIPWKYIYRKLKDKIYTKYEHNKNWNWFRILVLGYLAVMLVTMLFKDIIFDRGCVIMFFACFTAVVMEEMGKVAGNKNVLSLIHVLVIAIACTGIFVSCNDQPWDPMFVTLLILSMALLSARVVRNLFERPVSFYSAVLFAGLGLIFISIFSCVTDHSYQLGRLLHFNVWMEAISNNVIFNGITNPDIEPVNKAKLIYDFMGAGYLILYVVLFFLAALLMMYISHAICKYSADRCSVLLVVSFVFIFNHVAFFVRGMGLSSMILHNSLVFASVYMAPFIFLRCLVFFKGELEGADGEPVQEMVNVNKD